MPELTYLEKLNNIGLSIVGDFIGPAMKYIYTCHICGITHDGPSISAKLSSFAKFNSNGCPHCKAIKLKNKQNKFVIDTIKEIKSTGVDVLCLYPGDKKIQVYRPDCGHTHDIDLGRYSRGYTVCPECGKHSAKGIIKELTDDYINKMNNLNIKLVDKFTHRDDVHKFECLTCHTEFSGVFNFKLNLDNPCPTCLHKHLSDQKLDKTYTDKLLALNIKINGEYKGAGKQHQLECLVCHHQWSTNPGSKIRASKRGQHYGQCPVCAKQRQQLIFNKTHEQNLETLKARGFEILSDNTNNRRSFGGTLQVRNTKCQHVFISNAANLFSNNIECPVCNTQRKRAQFQEYNRIKSIEYAKTASEWELYRSQVISYTRFNVQEYPHIVNPNKLQIGRAGVEGAHHIDHIVPVRWCFNNNVPDVVCGDISNLQTIPWQENLTKSAKFPSIIPETIMPFISNTTIINWFIESITSLHSDVIIYDIYTLPPYELTVYFPKLKIGFILCLYTEYYQQYTQNKYIHLQLHEQATTSNIKLYQVYQDEWCLNSTLVLNKIKHLLHITTDTSLIPGRRCNLQEIDNGEASKFLNQYHIQGTDASGIRVGAYYESELVAVMTFCRPRVLMSDQRNINGNTYELSRFATNDKYRIPGIASKLLKYFERNYDYEYVYSYADLRWSDGNVYYKMGFTLQHQTPPNYYYIIDNKRKHRWGFRKDMLKTKLVNYDPQLTEYQNMLNSGHDRVWDCGMLKFVKHKPI